VSRRTVRKQKNGLIDETLRIRHFFLESIPKQADYNERTRGVAACRYGEKFFGVKDKFEMKIHTTRFGSIEIEPDDILFFRNGLLGFEDCRHWVLLADADNASVAWMQSMQHADIAMPVVSPRRFVADYQVRLENEDVDTLQLSSVEQAYVLGVVSRDEETLTLNLRAPLVINLDRRIGCQVVTVDNQPLQYELTTLPVSLRRSA